MTSSRIKSMSLNPKTGGASGPAEASCLLMFQIFPFFSSASQPHRPAPSPACIPAGQRLRFAASQALDKRNISVLLKGSGLLPERMKRSHGLPFFFFYDAEPTVRIDRRPTGSGSFHTIAVRAGDVRDKIVAVVFDHGCF